MAPTSEPYDLPTKVILSSPTAARSRSKSRAMSAELMCASSAPLRSSAAPHVGLRPRREGRHVERLGAREGLGVDPQLLGVGIAVEGRAARPDAARVDADDVEAPARCSARTGRRRAAHELHAGAARPAGMDEQRADAVLAVDRREAHEREVDRATARTAVVERHLRGGALKAVVAVASSRSRRDRRVLRRAGRRGGQRQRCERRLRAARRAWVAETGASRRPNRRTRAARSGPWPPRSHRRCRSRSA